MQAATRMRKPRRHRWLTVSVFLIAYSVFQAVLSSTVTVDQKSTDDKADPDVNIFEGDEPTELPVEVQKEVNSMRDEIKELGKILKKEEDNPDKTDDEESPPETDAKEGGKKSLKGLEEEESLEEESKDANEGDKKKQKDAGYEKETKPKNQTTQKLKDTVPTVHALKNCTVQAIEQFPRDIIGKEARAHGGLIIHILVAIFTFIGLAIVCDDYFVSSLDRICEELKLAPDVAGATFMAAGSSAPELATVIIGVFCAQDDIGVSGVIGSAVFNIMFVISVCALCAGTVSHLNWWPLCRDCFFYAISILVMFCTICNGYVSWPEALFMLIMYGVYCVALRFNPILEAWVLTLPLPFKLPTREEQAALVTYRSAVGQPAAGGESGDNKYTQMEGQNKETSLQTTPYNPDAAYDNSAYNAEVSQTWDPNHTWDPDQAWSADGNTGGVNTNTSWNSTAQQPAPQKQPSLTSPDQQQNATQQPAQQSQGSAVPAYYKAKEYNPETAINPLVKPVGANSFRMVYWYVTFPIHWACLHTMPDCHGRWYPVTFIISMLWISFYSYFMVWMITIIGFTLGIPDTVMGLTFVAAGVSVPDAISSLAVIKEGYGDMAVSNAVGSNVFDILVCLGLPWFLQTAIIHPGSHVNVISKGLIYSTLSLLSTVVFLVVATHANGWKLDRKYGIVLMVWYLLFITFASLYELNVFGKYHRPDCESQF